MPVGLVTLAVTTNGWGGGTVTSSRAISGDILAVRMDNGGTAVTTGGTADFTFTKSPDGGTVLALTNASAPFEYRVGQQLFNQTGGSVIYAAGTAVYTDGVPVFGTVTMTVAQGAGSASGTVYMYYRR